MDNLGDRLKASIENLNSDLWFPELTADLAARTWEGLRRDLGLAPNTYGTERVLSHCGSAPRDIIGSLLMAVPGGPAPAIFIETVSREYAFEYQKKGVSFYSPSELHTTVLSCLEEAIDIINQVPSLMRTVALLVRSLHLIKPEDEYHDVSFSELHAPFSIFVSVPGKRIANDSLRVAEAIVHEAMHLQLTLIEEHSRIVNNDAGSYFSPWRREFRTATGIMHGLYVFSVVEAFLGRVQFVSQVNYEAIEYIANRRKEIHNQIAGLHSFDQSQQLTELGSKFAMRLTRIDKTAMSSLRRTTCRSQITPTSKF